MVITIKALQSQFTPQDINLQDDAIHSSGISGHVETWYYDALFSNKYSIVALINLIRIKQTGLVLTGMFIYNDTKLICSKRKKFSFRHLTTNSEKPLLIIKNQPILQTTTTSKNSWNFQVTMGNQTHGFDLHLSPTTTPWKGKTYLGNWLAIPRYKATGIIYHNNQPIEVSGHGYHDHNIYPLYAPLFNKGYHFGKIPTKDINLTWAQLIKNQGKISKLVVLNQNSSYYSFHPDNITITIDSTQKDHNKIVPKDWSIYAKEKQLTVEAHLKTINYHHIKVPSVNYWRYHQHITGNITMNKKTYPIDTIEISEYLRFL